MRSAFRVSGAVAAFAAIVAASMALVSAQNDANCVSLRGSTMCPAFQDASINPSNLTEQFEFLENVTDAASFDSAFSSYLQTTSDYHMDKIRVGLQCNRTGSNGIVIQWEQTFYCGQFAQQSYAAGCTTNQTQPLVVGTDTCTEHSASQQSIVDNPVDCAPTDRLYPNHNETRIETLAADNNTCDNWTNLLNNQQAFAVMGLHNEINCGFGGSVSAQLCASCDPSGNRTVPTCCTALNTTSLAGCSAFGFPGAAAVQPYTSSSGTPSSTSSSASSTGMNGTSRPGSNAASNVNQNNVGLSKGQLAGILVGSIIGAILLGALLAFLLCGGKRKKNDPESHRMAGGAVYGAPGTARSNSGDKPWTQSEDGMSRTMAGSPDATKAGAAGVGSGVGSSSNNHNYLGLGALGAGAAGAGAAGAAAAGAGDRHSPAAGRPTSEALTSSSGAEGRGTTVTTVRDQYTGQDIHVGEDVVAIYPYNASLNDEITLEPEQHVTILRLYDDGWALGRTADGHEGALPLVCVSSTKGDVPGRQGTGTGTGTTTGTSDDEGLTSGNEYTSSVDGAVTAEEGATSDARSNRSRAQIPGAAR